MSGKATVLFLKETGHVLAATTRVDEPEAKRTVDSFVATNITMRGLAGLDSVPSSDSREFHIAAEHLAVGVTDLKPALLASAHYFVVEDLKTASPNVLGPNAPIATTPPCVDPTATATKLTATAITIALKTPAPAGLDNPVAFWAQIEGVDSLARPAIQIVRDKIPEKTITKDFSLSPSLVAKTKYLVMIGVAGMPLFVAQLETP
jgi:hypothetical protein